MSIHRSPHHSNILESRLPSLIKKNIPTDKFRIAITAPWLLHARFFVVILSVAFLATGCGGGTHPH